MGLGGRLAGPLPSPLKLLALHLSALLMLGTGDRLGLLLAKPSSLGSLLHPVLLLLGLDGLLGSLGRRVPLLRVLLLLPLVGVRMEGRGQQAA